MTPKLRQQIDEFFSGDQPRPQLSSDAEFLRRVSIDLVGLPPSAQQTVQFLEDNDPEKREKLVDRLLASPKFERFLANALDVILMERRPYKEIKQPEWDAYLLESVRENKPWNVLAREILAADGIKEQTRPAVRFALSRDAEPNLLARDIGRIFFGRDLQCAQCHDHPLVEDYLQSDYQGMLAFVAPGFIKTIKRPGPQTKEGKPGKPVPVKIYAEKDGNDLDFQSVFIKESKHRTGPRLIGVTAMVEPDRVSIPDANLHRPEYSRRDILAKRATDGTNRAFNENIANRLWAHLFGRGLVDPPDFHHRDNPPVHPALMKLLGAKIAEMNFDIKAFLKELALTQVYQRAFDFPTSSVAPAELTSQLDALNLKRQSLSEQIDRFRSKYDSAREAWAEAESKYIPIAIEVEKLQKNLAAQSANAKKLKVEFDKAETEHERQRVVRESLKGSLQNLRQALDTLKNDKAILDLVARLDSKLESIQKKTQSLMQKVAATEKSFLAAEKKRDEAEKALISGFAKKKPFQAALMAAEKKARVHRTQFGDAVTARASLESQIATLEKLRDFVELQVEIEAADDSSSGESESQLLADQSQLLASLNIRLANNHTLATLKPLSPEQLAWTTLAVTGVYDRTHAAEVAKFRKEKSIPADQKLTPPQLRTVDDRTQTGLKGHLANFIRYYAAGAGQPQGDFFATADQALFASNAGTLNSYVGPSGNNVTQRIIQAKNPAEAARQLYLSILTRLPTAEEIADVQSYLAGKSDRRSAAMELVWSLINSAEFRFNH